MVLSLNFNIRFDKSQVCSRLLFRICKHFISLSSRINENNYKSSSLKIKKYRLRPSILNGIRKVSLMARDQGLLWLGAEKNIISSVEQGKNVLIKHWNKSSRFLRLLSISVYLSAFGRHKGSSANNEPVFYFYFPASGHTQSQLCTNRICIRARKLSSELEW